MEEMGANIILNEDSPKLKMRLSKQDVRDILVILLSQEQDWRDSECPTLAIGNAKVEISEFEHCDTSGDSPEMKVTFTAKVYHVVPRDGMSPIREHWGSLAERRNCNGEMLSDSIVEKLYATAREQAALNDEKKKQEFLKQFHPPI